MAAREASKRDLSKPVTPVPGSANEARAELAKMMSEKGGPLLNGGHPEHAAAVKKFHELAARV